MANAAGSAISPSQNSHDASSASTIRPAITSPTPPPMPNVALIPPIAVDDALGRERLADDPEREREDAAADALDDAPEHEHAERRRERAHRAAGGERQQHTVRTRPRPNRSPSLPTIGVATAAASR